MIDFSQYVFAFLEGATKVLPAVLAAYYAYRLWYVKLAQDRADAILKGCLILHHFCISLERHLSDNPDRPNSVVIESVNANLDSILSTRTASARFGELLETYYLWRKGVYFPQAKDNETDLVRRRTFLNEYASGCDAIIAVIRSSTPSELVKLRFASL